MSPTQSDTPEPHQVIISRPLCVPPNQQKIERAYRGRSEPCTTESIVGKSRLNRSKILLKTHSTINKAQENHYE